MSDRTGKQLAMDVIPEMEDAEEAMVIIVHKDGTTSWHGTNSRLHSKLGMLRFVTVLVEQAVMQTEDVASTAKKEVIQ